MAGEESMAPFYCLDSLCTLVKMSVRDKKEMMFSRSSGVLNGALRAASVVILRVWRRGVVGVVRVVFRFCFLGELCTHSNTLKIERVY